MGAPALYATPANASAVHELETVEKMARLLGTPLMAWQSQVARVATERRADGKGWRYPIVVLTVPRQSGKTTLMRAIMSQRTLRYPGTQAFYTAQSGKDARERWGDLIKIAEQKFPSLVSVRRGAGAECMEWLNGRGQVRTFAPTRTALHGYTPELVMIDEAFAFDEDLGAALMAAIIPAQATLSERQLWIVSTAGDAAATWFKAWVDKGRESLADPLSLIAFFEWAAPEGLDIQNTDNFALFHPAHGYTQDSATFAQARDHMDRHEFDRAFGNRWSVVKTTVIPGDVIEATTNTNQTPPDDPAHMTLAYDVAPDRSAASIWACWSDETGTHLRPYLSKPGTWWLQDAIMKARDEMGVERIAADDGGPARSATAALALRGIEVTRLSARDFASATGDFIDALTTGTVDHNADAAFLDGLEGAALRRLGETDAWSRRDSVGPIHDVIAATVALRIHTFTHDTGKPMVVFS